MPVPYCNLGHHRCSRHTLLAYVLHPSVRVKLTSSRPFMQVAFPVVGIMKLAKRIGNRLYIITTWGSTESVRPAPLSLPLPDYFFANEGRKRDNQETVHGETSRCPASRESELLRVRSSNRGQGGQSGARIRPFEGQVEEQRTGRPDRLSSMNRKPKQAEFTRPLRVGHLRSDAKWFPDLQKEG